MQIGTIVKVKRPLGFPDNALDVGKVVKSRNCPVLMWQELLVEFPDGGQGWYRPNDLKEIGNES